MPFPSLPQKYIWKSSDKIFSAGFTDLDEEEDLIPSTPEGPVMKCTGAEAADTGQGLGRGRQGWHLEDTPRSPCQSHAKVQWSGGLGAGPILPSCVPPSPETHTFTSGTDNHQGVTWLLKMQVWDRMAPSNFIIFWTPDLHSRPVFSWCLAFSPSPPSGRRSQKVQKAEEEGRGWGSVMLI